MNHIVIATSNVYGITLAGGSAAKLYQKTIYLLVPKNKFECPLSSGVNYL